MIALVTVHWSKVIQCLVKLVVVVGRSWLRKGITVLMMMAIVTTTTITSIAITTIILVHSLAIGALKATRSWIAWLAIIVAMSIID